MIRIVLLFLFVIPYLLFSLPVLWFLKLVKPGDGPTESDRWIYKLPNHLGRTVLKITGTKVKVSGLEHIPDNEPVLFVSNHQGIFDIFVLLGLIGKPKGFISKIEVKKLPIINQWMEAMHCVFLDRKDRRQALSSIKKGIQLLKDGHSLVIFPEGTRSQSDEMAPFKPGSLRLAVKSGVPIVPVTIMGTYKVFEQNGLAIKPAEVKLVIHPQVTITEDADLNELSDRVQATIAKPFKYHYTSVNPQQSFTAAERESVEA